MTPVCCTLFQNEIHLFTGIAQFLHLMVFSLSKIGFYGVKKIKGKLVFRKIENIHVWHFVSYVAHKRNPVDNIK